MELKEKGLTEDDILRILKGDGTPKDERPLCPYALNRGRCNGIVDGSDCEYKPYNCEHYEDVIK